MGQTEQGRSSGTIAFGIRWDGGKRPRSLRLWAAAVMAAALAALVPAAADARRPAAPPLHDALVIPAPGRSADARALVHRLGGTAGERIAVVRGFSARVPAGALARLNDSSAVRVASPDAPLSVSSDSGADKAAASMEIVRAAAGLDGVRAAGTDGSGVGVALVDSGARIEDGLDSGQVAVGPDFSTEGGSRRRHGVDGFGHGTHLAGVIAGDAGAWEGVAPGAHVVSVKVANSAGETSLLRVLAGLEWVRQARAKSGLGIRVVNLSLGVEAGDAGYVREPLAFAAERLWKSGLVVVAAAGNDGADTGMLDVPAADPYVIAVGALDTARTADTGDDSVASFSSRSATRPPDVVAPGAGIVSLRAPGSTLDTAYPGARVGERFFRGTGTSQATAVVSGIAALLLQQRPGLQPDQLKALLTAGATPVAAEGDARAAQGAGAVDAARSAALRAPSARAAAQDWPEAVLDRATGKLDVKLARLLARLAGSTWSGSTWSGSTWSGSTWSGSTWSGSTWSGSTWSGSTWSGSTWSGSTWSGSTWSGSTWSSHGWGDL
jgi:serine protease AprX